MTKVLNCRLEVSLNSCSSTMMDLALNNPQRLICHLKKNLIESIDLCMVSPNSFFDILFAQIIPGDQL